MILVHFVVGVVVVAVLFWLDNIPYISELPINWMTFAKYKNEITKKEYVGILVMFLWILWSSAQLINLYYWWCTELLSLFVNAQVTSKVLKFCLHCFVLYIWCSCLKDQGYQLLNLPPNFLFLFNVRSISEFKRLCEIGGMEIKREIESITSISMWVACFWRSSYWSSITRLGN